MLLSARTVLCGDRNGIVYLPGKHVTIVSKLGKFIITRGSGILVVYPGSSGTALHHVVASMRVGLKRRFV